MIFLYSNPKYQVTSMNYYTEPDTIYFKNCMMLICLNVSKGLKSFFLQTKGIVGIEIKGGQGEEEGKTAAYLGLTPWLSLSH